MEKPGAAKPPGEQPTDLWHRNSGRDRLFGLGLGGVDGFLGLGGIVAGVGDEEIVLDGVRISPALLVFDPEQAFPIGFHVGARSDELHVADGVQLVARLRGGEDVVDGGLVVLPDGDAEGGGESASIGGCHCGETGSENLTGDRVCAHRVSFCYREGIVLGSRPTG